MASATSIEARAQSITEYLLSALGHKLRTPLSVIANESYVLSKSAPSLEIQKISEKSREISAIIAALEEIFKRRGSTREIDLENCLRAALEGITSKLESDGALVVKSDGTWEQILVGIGQLCRLCAGSVNARISESRKISIEIQGMRIHPQSRKGTLLCAIFDDLFLPVLACVDVLMLTAASSVEVSREADRVSIFIQIKG